MDEHIATLKAIHEKTGITLLGGSLMEELPEQLMSCVAMKRYKKREKALEIE